MAQFALHRRLRTRRKVDLSPPREGDLASEIARPSIDDSGTRSPSARGSSYHSLMRTMRAVGRRTTVRTASAPIVTANTSTDAAAQITDTTDGPTVRPGPAPISFASESPSTNWMYQPSGSPTVRRGQCD